MVTVAMPVMDRRALMRTAILLVGGSAIGLADAAWAADAPAWFAPPQRATLDAVCDTMIPRTDTPGAVEAGVPGFIDSMMANWASEQTQAQFRAVVDGVDKAALAATGKGFAALSPAERHGVLSTHDAASRGDPAYMRFRELLLTGYYLSEAGATQELRYELVPGVWEPAVPVTSATRTWAV